MKQIITLLAFSVIFCSLIGCSNEKTPDSSSTDKSAEFVEIEKTTESTEPSTEPAETVFVGTVYDYTQGDLSFTAKSVSDGSTVIIDASQMSSKAFGEMLYVSNQSTVTITHKGFIEEDGKMFLANIVSMDVEIYDIYGAAGITDEDVVRTLRNLVYHREVDFSEDTTEISLEATVKETENGLAIDWRMINNSSENITYTPAYILSGIDTIGGDGKYHDFMDGYSFEEAAYVCEAGSEVSDELLLPEGFRFLIDMRFAKSITIGEKVINIYTDIPSQY